MTQDNTRSPSAPQQPAFAPGGAHGGASSGSHSGPAASGSTPSVPKPPPLSREARAALQEEFRAVLGGGVHGFCFSPYLEGQSPGAQVSAAQIRARLEVIRPHTAWVRTFWMSRLTKSLYPGAVPGLPAEAYNSIGKVRE